MKRLTSRGALVLAAAVGMLVADPAICLAGPSIMAVTDYGGRPLRLAKVRISHVAEAGYGDEVICSFDHPDYDFGHVVVRSSQPLSVVRRNMRVYFSSRALVIDTGGGETGEAVEYEEIEIWLRIDGKIQPGRTYEWEAELGSSELPKEGSEVALPLLWADGQQISSTTVIFDPRDPDRKKEKDEEEEEDEEKVEEDPNPVDEDPQIRLPIANGVVTMPDFKRQTGGAWVVLKPKEFGKVFGVLRFSLREVDDDRSGRMDTAMPAPTAYVPCRDRVDDLVALALREGKAFLTRLQHPEGPWPVGGSIEDVVYWTSRIAKVLAEVESRTPRVNRAFRWLADQEPEEGQVWQTRTVAARLHCLARHGGMSAYRRVIYSDAEFLSEAQQPDGGWLATDDQRTRVLNRSGNTVSFDVLMALREARIAGVQVDRVIWRKALNYWLEAQAFDGGYYDHIEKYGGVGLPPSIAQTATGVAALIALSDMNTGLGGRSCASRVAGHSHAKAISDAIDWLNREYDPTAEQPMGAIVILGHLDDPFLEADRMRAVGAISGLQEFNGYNHFFYSAKKLTENYAKGVGQFGVAGREPLNLHRTAWALDILGAGNAPTICQRITVGGGEEDTSQFKCDVPHLVRYISEARRRQFNWRHVSIDTDIEELVRVPITILNFVGPPDWSEAQWNQLRLYAFAGGTIVANIDEDFEGDRQEVVSGLSAVFPEYEFRRLPDDHLVFEPDKLDKEDVEDDEELEEAEEDSIADDGEPSEDVETDRPGLVAMGNGFREFMFVADENWSCHWHLYKTDEFRASFEFMNNLLRYATDGSPPRDSFWESTYPADTVNLQALSAKYIEVGADKPAYPDHMFYLDRLLRYNYRLAVNRVEDDEDADLIWISVTGGEFGDDDKVKLRRAVRSGAFLFIDIVGGDEDWAENFQTALQDAVDGVSLEHARRTSPVYTGEIPGTRGFNAVNVRFRKSLQSRFRKRGRCDLYNIVDRGRVVGTFSTHDITSGVGYNLYPGCRGVVPGDARKVAMNVVLLACAQRLGLDIWGY